MGFGHILLGAAHPRSPGRYRLPVSLSPGFCIRPGTTAIMKSVTLVLSALATTLVPTPKALHSALSACLTDRPTALNSALAGKNCKCLDPSGTGPQWNSLTEKYCHNVVLPGENRACGLTKTYHADQHHQVSSRVVGGDVTDLVTAC